MKSHRNRTFLARPRRAPFLVLTALITLVTVFSTATRPVLADGQPVVASVIAIDGKLTCERPGKGKYAAFVQMPDYTQDVLSTDANSVAALEFTVGGKIGINKGSAVRIIGNRSAADATSGQVLKLDSGTIWAKFDKQKSPLYIRTRNTTIGIRGTEFLVEAGTDSTTIDVFEGTVAYSATKEASGEATDASLPANAPTATAGMRVVIDTALKADVKTYDPAKLRQDDAQRYKDIATVLVSLRVISNIAGFVPGGSPVSTYAGYAAWGIEAVNDPAKAAGDWAASQVSSRIGIGIPNPFGGGGGGAKKDPPFPIDLQPYQKDAAPPSLTFSWKPLKDAKKYVVLVSKDESMNQGNLAWATQVSDTSATYPNDGPPLEPGQKYYWRVVGMDGDGKAKGKASQTWFMVPSSYKPAGQ